MILRLIQRLNCSIRSGNSSNFQGLRDLNNKIQQLGSLHSVHAYNFTSLNCMTNKTCYLSTTTSRLLAIAKLRDSVN